jgi:hypothetical protein
MRACGKGTGVGGAASGETHARIKKSKMTQPKIFREDLEPIASPASNYNP